MKKLHGHGFTHLSLLVVIGLLSIVVMGTAYRISHTFATASDSVTTSTPRVSSTPDLNLKQTSALTSDQAPVQDSESQVSDISQENKQKYALYYAALDKASVPPLAAFTGQPRISSSKTHGYTLARVTINGPGSYYFYSTDTGKTWVYVGNTSDEWECDEFTTPQARAAYKGTQCYDSTTMSDSVVE